jgi:DNA-binding CsgD family transcriptional regulator
MYRSFINALTSGQSLNEICDVSGDICDYYGYDHFSYSARIPVSLITPRYLVIERCMATTHTISDQQPTNRFVRQYIGATTPVYWDKQQIAQNQEIIAGQTADYTEPSVSEHGLTIPIHTRHTGSAMMNYSMQGSNKAAAETIEKTLPEIFLLASHTHEAISKFIDFDDYQVNVSQVSKREKECLRWSTEGITTAAIATRLGISQSTVTFHLQNAMRKLGASNRQQAIARAILLGVI